MSITYTSRPPASARMARNAWDYFQARRATERRGIDQLFFCPNYDFSGVAHWCCILKILDHDTMHWNFSESDVTWAEQSTAIREWVDDGRPALRPGSPA